MKKAEIKVGSLYLDKRKGYRYVYNIEGNNVWWFRCCEPCLAGYMCKKRTFAECCIGIAHKEVRKAFHQLIQKSLRNIVQSTS